MFTPNKSYTKQAIYEILQVPINKRRGAWDTGYHQFNGDIFIFSNVGIPGRTGHDYDNYWDGDHFHWEGKRRSRLTQPLIQKMLDSNNRNKIHLFTRLKDRDPFTYEGTVKPFKYFDTSPVRIIWRFDQHPYSQAAEEILSWKEQGPIYEGTSIKISVNKYERNPLARRLCIEHHGTHCNVCDFDFYVTYGDLGKGYIHVHHIIPISSLGDNYIINPETDLVPVCPNCHSMVHKENPPIPPENLRHIVEERR